MEKGPTVNLRGRGRLAALALVAAGVAVVVFKVPLSTVLLFALVLACPLLMAGMHGGHGGRAGHDADGRSEQHRHDVASRD